MPVFLDQAKAHPESGLYFDPPHGRCFRLDQGEHAATLFKSFGVQEMDFGWWDAAKQAMHLLEVKDYSRPDASFNHEHFLNECLQKASDCLLLLASIWYDLPCAPQARDSVPDERHTRPADPPRLDMFFVVKVAESGRGEAVRDPLGLDQLQVDQVAGFLGLADELVALRVDVGGNVVRDLDRVLLEADSRVVGRRSHPQRPPERVDLVGPPETHVVPLPRVAADGLLEGEILLAAPEQKRAHRRVDVRPPEQPIRPGSRGRPRLLRQQGV